MNSLVARTVLVVALVSGLLAALHVPAPAQERATYRTWQEFRNSQAHRADVIRYYTFEQVADSDSVVPNLAQAQAPLRYAQAEPEELRIIEGRWPDKRAVRLDRGYFHGRPFPVENQSFTVEAWVRKNGHGSLRGNHGSTNGTLLSVGVGWWDGWRITASYPELVTRFQIGRPAPVNAISISAGPMCDGVWEHLAATWDGERMRLYLNGEVVAEEKYTGQYTAPRADAQFRVGYAGYGVGSVVLDVDEVTIYNRALSAEELREHAVRFAPAPIPASEAVQAAFGEGNAAVMEGDWRAAQRAFQGVLTLPDVHPHYRGLAHIRLIHRALQARDFRAALDHLDDGTAVEGLPEYHEPALEVLFRDLVRMGAPDALPRRVYEAALALPNLSDQERLNAHVHLARALRSEGDLAAARAQYQEVIQMDGVPDRTRLDMELELAHLLLAEADIPAAAEAYGRLADRDDIPPHYRTIALLRGAEAHLRGGNTAAARAALARVEQIPGGPEHHAWEAQERIAEIERVEAGLPARDPLASRTEIPRITQFAAEVFVSPEGDDAQEGSEADPVASLGRARDLVRDHLRAGVDGPIAVNVLPGEYLVTETFELASEDSGTPEAPVVYRSTEPGGAVFYGGTRITGFEPVTDPAILARLPEEARGEVYQCDLRAQSIEDYGELAVRGAGQPSEPPPTLELFVNREPMTLARWPNEGFVDIAGLVEPGSREGDTPSVIEYLDDRHERWTDAEDLWLFGYFRWLWADAAMPVSRIDTDARHVIFDGVYRYGGTFGMDDRQGIRYYAFNLLEEMDMPGEWYLDRETGVLYLYPPTDLETATVEIGMLSGPMVTMDEVTDVRLEGLTFDLGRHDGIVMRDSSRCLILGCTVSRVAGKGISVLEGHENGLVGCDIHTTGRRASEVFGGNRETLTPGGHFVENCRLHNFARIDRTYNPAVHLEGVGNRVAHNLMYNSPSSVMRIEGNDHIIEFNQVHSAVLESDDQGAMELYANPTYRGVVFRYNRFTNCGLAGTGAMAHGQAAIRLDDAISGMLIYGNVFIRSANGRFGGVQMNSGRDNIMDNNLFIDCAHGVTGGWNAGNAVWRWIEEGRQPDNFYTNELYLERYPKIATMMEPPGISHVWRNVFYRCGPHVTRPEVLDLVENAVFADADPGFVDAAAGDYRLRPDAPLFDAVTFRPIPMDEIGLYEDDHRASWPVETTPVELPDWRP